MKEVKRYKTARMNLIVMLAFTLCNVGLGLYGSDRYYLFSNTLSYVFAIYGRAYYEALGDKIDLLVVDGWVYARQEGVMESAYTISAQVDGHNVATSMSALGSQTIEVDGEVIAKKQRLY